MMTLRSKAAGFRPVLSLGYAYRPGARNVRARRPQGHASGHIPARFATAATHALALFIAAAMFWPQAAQASGCEGASVYSDDFQEVDPSWAQDDDPPSVEENRLKLKVTREGKSLFISGVPLPEGEICVTLRSPNELSDPSASEAGLVFRAVRIPGAGRHDYSYMFFSLSPDGKASLATCLLQNQRDTTGVTHLVTVWRSIRVWPEAPGARKGRGASNDLRVSLRRGPTGIELSLFINDARLELGHLSLPLLVGGGEFGLRAVAEKGRRNTWKFSDFQVADPPHRSGE
jgi:hypothetical protein